MEVNMRYQSCSVKKNRDRIGMFRPNKNPNISESPDNRENKVRITLVWLGLGGGA